METLEATINDVSVSNKNSDFSFQVEKEVLYNGLKIVERATVQKGLQPVLANVLFSAVDKNTINLFATDFDLTITTSIEAVITKIIGYYFKIK